SHLWATTILVKSPLWGALRHLRVLLLAAGAAAHTGAVSTRLQERLTPVRRSVAVRKAAYPIAVERRVMPYPLRIFFSSPSEVSVERRRAALVVEKLAKEYARFFQITPVLWDRSRCWRPAISRTLLFRRLKPTLSY